MSGCLTLEIQSTRRLALVTFEATPDNSGINEFLRRFVGHQRAPSAPLVCRLHLSAATHQEPASSPSPGPRPVIDVSVAFRELALAANYSETAKNIIQSLGR